MSLFNVEAAKSEIQKAPRANPAKRANPGNKIADHGNADHEISTISTISTGTPSNTQNIESRIWHVIYGRWDSHAIYPKPVSAERVKQDFPTAELLEPTFPRQEGTA